MLQWRQTSNPVTRRRPGVEGYEDVEVAYRDHQWGGLEYCGGHHSFLSGSVGHAGTGAGPSTFFRNA